MKDEEIIEFSEKFEPLFELLEGKHPEVDLVIVTGGRLGSKSYGVSTCVAEGFIQEDWQAIYTRFTNVSGQDSTVPEFSEKLDLLGYSEYAKEVGNRFESLCGTGKVVFKGLKAGSATQSANLKSLKGFNCWVNDESEEIPDYNTFRKIFLSIRSTVKRNVTILILNPTTKDFWLHERFFKPKNIPNMFNGIVDNVMYIHTTYLDVPRKYIPDNIWKDYEYQKANYPDEYEHVILGGWLADLEGSLFKHSELDRFKLYELNTENTEGKIGAIDVADEGTDSLSYPVGYVIGEKIYVTDWLFTTENTEYTIPESTAQTRRHRLDYLAIETNNHGSLFYKQVNNEISGTGLIGVHQSSNKHSRIIQNAHFIRTYFVFRDDYEAGSDYDLAMKELFAYLKNGEADHDDAPDSLALLAALARDLYQDRWI